MEQAGLRLDEAPLQLRVVKKEVRSMDLIDFLYLVAAVGWDRAIKKAEARCKR